MNEFQLVTMDDNNRMTVHHETSGSRLDLIMKVRKEQPKEAVIIDVDNPEQVLYRYVRPEHPKGE